MVFSKKSFLDQVSERVPNIFYDFVCSVIWLVCSRRVGGGIAYADPVEGSSWLQQEAIKCYLVKYRVK